MKLSDLAAQLDQDHRVRLARGTVVLPLPFTSVTPDGDTIRYAARFGVLHEDAVADFVKWQQTPDTSAEEDIDAVADLIAEACQQILARPKKAEAWEPLTGDGGEPVVFNAALADALGFTLPEQSKVAVVRACWTTDEDTVSRGAIVTFGLRLSDWMADTTAAVEDEIVGGLPGGPR